MERWAYAIPVCMCCLCLGIVSNQSADAFTDHSQSAKDIDPYFQFQLYAEDHGRRKLVLILPSGLRKPRERERTHWVDGIPTRNLLIDSPACYH